MATQMKPKLPNGMHYGYTDKGEKICRGAIMGRPSRLPENPNEPIKLQMIKLRIDSGGYDQGGAYWGLGEPVYWAGQGLGPDAPIQIFVRGKTREDAKTKVRNLVPGASFFA
jgi:hypothetical protein